MIKNADISECKKYRYSLERTWDETKPKVLFIMLNPSIADSKIDDRTISKCIKYSQNWDNQKYGGLFVVNLFPLISTDPYELLLSEELFGEGTKNIDTINKLSTECELTICSWGNAKIIRKLSMQYSNYKPLKNLTNKIHTIKLSKDGTTPLHPLYLQPELEPLEIHKSIVSRFIN